MLSTRRATKSPWHLAMTRGFLPRVAGLHWHLKHLIGAKLLDKEIIGFLLVTYAIATDKVLCLLHRTSFRLTKIAECCARAIGMIGMSPNSPFATTLPIDPKSVPLRHSRQLCQLLPEPCLTVHRAISYRLLCESLC